MSKYPHYAKFPYVAGQIRRVCLPPNHMHLISARLHYHFHIVESYNCGSVMVYTDKGDYHICQDLFVPPSACQAMKKAHEEKILEWMLDTSRPSLDVTDLAGMTGSTWWLAKEAADGLVDQGAIRHSRFSEDAYELVH